MKSLRSFIFAGLALAFLLSPALAQTFQSLGSASLSVTTSSDRVALPATTFGNNITIQNVGTAEAFVNFGSVTVTAATTNESVPAGAGRCFAQQGFTYVAGITAASTTTLRISQGSGPCSISFRGGTPGAAGLTVGTSVISGGTTTRVLFDNAGVLGEYAISGTGSVAMTTSPAFTTPAVGVASGTSLALGGCTIGANSICGAAGAFTNLVASGYGMFGSATALTLTAGAIGMAKITASGTAPGAAGAKLEVVCGTNAGTAKLIIAAGTSGTAVTVADNVGAGVTGC